MKAPNFSNVYEDMQWRGALSDMTPGAREALIDRKVSIYVGFDPTAPSLHIGNLIPIMALMRMQAYGHSPIALVGGGTGMIGDPSGRSDERAILSVVEIDTNLQSLHRQLERFLDFDDHKNPARIVNNAEWLRPVTLLEFLRDAGKHFSINTMLGRESVKTRQKTGISFTEFSYQVLQAYDFLQLYNRYNCDFQGGGSDQWGNILGGVELIRKVRGAEAHALVYPLVVNSKGEKFGKSVNGAPTLDSEQTSPFHLYQFLLNTSDEEVISYLKLLTMIPAAEIVQLQQAVKVEPTKRTAQHRLAREITRLVHGEGGLQSALRETKSLFEKKSEINVPFDAPSDAIIISAEELQEPPTLLDLVARVTASRGEVKRLARQGGLTVNLQAVSVGDLTTHVDASSFPYTDHQKRRCMVVKSGKKNYKVLVLKELKK